MNGKSRRHWGGGGVGGGIRAKSNDCRDVWNGGEGGKSRRDKRPEREKPINIKEEKVVSGGKSLSSLGRVKSGGHMQTQQVGETKKKISTNRVGWV